MGSDSLVSSFTRRLEGKVAIVTGGASGIGASTVRLFCENGAKVVIADVQDNLGQALAGNLNGNACYIHCDVTDETQVANLIDSTVAKFGRLDIMYSNAGIMDKDTRQSILSVQKHELERMIGVNLVGAFMAAKHAARVMVPNKKGCILFTASACTAIGGVASASYTASKYGVVGLMKSLATELGSDGIRVNCISPFGVLTGSYSNDETMKGVFEKIMGGVGNLKGKTLDAEDVAKAALYLGSDEAGYVSGMNLVVDGGYSSVNPMLINVARK